MLTALQLLGALLLLVIASDAFTNAVEWIGCIYGLTRSAAGAVVAAVGSSLPETMVAVVALVILRDPASQQVGIGAVLGAPFVLATLVFALIGTIALFRKSSQPLMRKAVEVPTEVATFGLAFFLLTFALVIGASFAPTPSVRLAAAGLVIAAYFVYLLRHFTQTGPECDETPPPLRISPGARRPPIALVFIQVAVALVVTVAASRWFVSSVSAVAVQIGVAPLIVSLFLSPIATELPEAMNVSIWLRRGQDELALSNVLGAMMFQTSIASAIAMLASPWHLSGPAYAACAATFAAASLVLLTALLGRRVGALPLASCVVFYVAYITIVAST